MVVSGEAELLFQRDVSRNKAEGGGPALHPHQQAAHQHTPHLHHSCHPHEQENVQGFSNAAAAAAGETAGIASATHVHSDGVHRSNNDSSQPAQGRDDGLVAQGLGSPTQRQVGLLRHTYVRTHGITHTFAQAHTHTYTYTYLHTYTQ